MGDEQDAWFKPFGFDPAKLANEVLERGKAVVAEGVKEIEADINKAKAFVEEKIDKGVKAIAGAVTPSGASPQAASATGAVSSPSSLGGSVGRGGQNNPGDVKGIQRALGISDDGKCGPATITAIENFQRSIGQARPDGRIDPGGPTARALASGAKGAAAPAPADDDSGSLFDRAVKGVNDLGGKILKEAEEDFDAAKEFGGKVLQGAENALDNPGILPTSLVSDLNAASGRGDLADQILAALKSGDNPARELRDLAKEDMRTILTVLAKVKQAGKLAALEERIPSNLSPRVGVAFLTVDLKFADVGWQQGVAKLSVDDRKAVLERTPTEFAAPFLQDVGLAATREEAEKALSDVLDKIQKAQGGSTLRVSDAVRVAGNAVAFGLPGADTKIKNLLARKDQTGQPAVLAREIASRLPPTIPRANLKRLAGLPVDEASATQAQTVLAALVAAVIKQVDPIIKLFPKAVQDELRKAVEDGVEAGLVGIVTAAMAGTKLDADSKKQIESIVGAGIKQHPNQSSFDNKQSGEGSPDARDRPPPLGPTQPEQPEIEDEKKFKGPEIKKLPDDPPPNPKPPEKPEKP